MTAELDLVAVALRVEAGAAWLAEEYGPQWWRKIDWQRFNIGYGQYCILGQLGVGYGSWAHSRTPKGLRSWPSANAFAEAHGLYAGCPVHDDMWSCFGDHCDGQALVVAALNTAWRQVAADLERNHRD